MQTTSVELFVLALDRSAVGCNARNAMNECCNPGNLDDGSVRRRPFYLHDLLDHDFTCES